MAVRLHAFTLDPDAERGLQQLKRLHHTLEDNPALLILVFANQPPNTLTEILPWFEALWPQASVVGSYCGAVIHQGKVEQNRVVVQCVQFSHTQVSMNLLPWHEPTAELGERLYAPIVKPDTRLALTLLSGDSQDYNRLFHWLNQTHPEVSVAGGRVRDGEAGWLYADGRFLYNHALAVSFTGREFQALPEAYTEWHQIGPTWTVTRSDGEQLFELDHQPTQTLYNLYLNQGKALAETDYTAFPLMRISGEREELITPLATLTDGGFRMSQPLKAGDRLRFTYSHPSMTFEQVCDGAQRFNESPPELMLAFNCISRLNLSAQQPEHELIPLTQVSPLNGIYCFGEIGHHKGQTRMLQHSMTVVGLAEEQTQSKALPSYERPSLAPLFRLIQASAKELDLINQDLAAEVDRKTHELLRRYETDPVTGLPNRVALLQSLEDNDPWPIVQLCSLKINNLRQINNLYGYTVGDQLLRSLSRAIQDALPELLPTTVLLFRGSPNEFLIAAPDACSHQAFFRGMAQLTERLQSQSDLFSDRLVQNVLPILLTAGTAHLDELPPDMTNSREDLLIKASEARRHAHHHQLPIARAVELPSSEHQKKDGLLWLSRIRKALASQGVVPFVQPLFDRNGQVHHVEALMRLRLGDEIHSPGAFLDLVKPTQLYPRLSMMMIDETCRLLKDQDVGFTLNFTARDLGNTQLIERLKHWFREGLDASRVTLEIVESDGLRDFDRFTYTLHELRRLGCKLAIDDFGSAYSNLERVLRLRPDWIKLDGSLIRHLNDSDINRILVKRVVQLCQDLHIRTVAEHVHNEALYTTLKIMGVDFFQGFYLAEPMPASEFSVQSSHRIVN
ncbi:MAG: bifunctional diguanylate cyclase/phosphodiesterase [Saccharospirillum sp.]